MTMTMIRNITNIRPLKGYIVVRPDEPAKFTESGIYLPNPGQNMHERQAPRTGTVIAVALDEKDESEFAPGDRILYVAHAGEGGGTYRDKDFIVMKEDSILAILEK